MRVEGGLGRRPLRWATGGLAPLRSQRCVSEWLSANALGTR